MGNHESNPSHLPSLIKVVIVVARKDLHVLLAACNLNNKMFARVVFQELGVTCV